MRPFISARLLLCMARGFAPNTIRAWIEARLKRQLEAHELEYLRQCALEARWADAGALLGAEVA